MRRIEEKRRRKFGDEVDEEGLQLDTIEKDGLEVEEENEVKPVKRSQFMEEESDDEDYEDVDEDSEADDEVDEAALAESKIYHQMSLLN